MNFITLPYRIFTGNFESYAYDGFALPVTSLFKRIEWAPLVVMALLFFKKTYQRKEVLFLIVFYCSVFFINFFFGSHQTRYIISSFYLGLLLVVFLLDFLKSEKIKRYLAVFLVLFVFYESGLSHYQAFKYIFNPRMDKFLAKNLYDYQQIYYKDSRKIPSKECGHMFEILSIRYAEDYAELRMGWQLGLEQAEFSSYSQLKTFLASKNIHYWMVNKTTTGYKTDGVARSAAVGAQADQAMSFALKNESLILANAKILEQDGTNYFLEL